MSGGGGGSSAPAAAPSGGCVSRLRQRHRSQSPADASAPDAPLTTTLDPSTNAEASPRTCPRTNATAPRANAGGATSAETTDVAVRHPTGAPHFFSRPRPPTTAPRRRSAAGFDFPFFPTTRATESRVIGPGGDDTSGLNPRPIMRGTSRGLSRTLERRCESRHRRARVRANPKRARKTRARDRHLAYAFRGGRDGDVGGRHGVFFREPFSEKLIVDAVGFPRRARRALCEAHRLTAETPHSNSSR